MGDQPLRIKPSDRNASMTFLNLLLLPTFLKPDFRHAIRAASEAL